MPFSLITLICIYPKIGFFCSIRVSVSHLSSLIWNVQALLSVCCNRCSGRKKNPSNCSHANGSLAHARPITTQHFPWLLSCYCCRYGLLLLLRRDVCSLFFGFSLWRHQCVAFRRFPFLCRYSLFLLLCRSHSSVFSLHFLIIIITHIFGFWNITYVLLPLNYTHSF